MAELRPRGPAPARSQTRKPIGEMLVQEGLVTEEQVQEALTLQKAEGGKTVEILIRLGHLSVPAFAAFVSKQHGVPSLDLSHYQISSELCQLVPREFAIRHEVFPIDRLGNSLTVGMVFPLDSDVLDELARITGLKVKAVLCNAVDVLSAIQQYYPKADEVVKATPGRRAETAVKIHHVAQLVRQIDSLPTLPRTIQKVREAVENPNSSLRRVAEIIANDPPVAARMLHLANSAAYGFPRQVDTVELAATLLGLRETYRVVLSSAIIDLTAKSKYFDHEKFWADSTFCATAAVKTARACGVAQQGGVFTAGLLHDIGRFALSETAPARYAKIDRSLTGDALIAAEMEALGIAHPEAGYILATRWSLPSDLVEPIRFHQHPERATAERETVTFVALAARMAEIRGSEPDEEALMAACGGVAAMLGLDALAVQKIFRESQG